MKHDITEQELRTAMDETKALLSEASVKGSLNDFWVVIDCDSENFRDYIHRSNTQGLIDIVCKKHKALCTRKVLNDIALFAAGDKDKAEKEAKRRAKTMKNELVTEAQDCKKCAANKENHERLSKKHKAAANNMSDAKKKAMLMNNSKFEAKLALTDKCADCKKSITENYYNPRNVVYNKQAAGASVDDTVHSAVDRQDHVSGAKPGPHDPTEPEHTAKVSVPKAITSVLTSRAKDAREYGEKLPVTHTEDKQFYSDLAQMFDDLNNYLKSGTVHDLKMANIFMTTLMGTMLYEIPTEVVRFIAYGGAHAPLKSFVNSITVPQGGFGAKIEK